MNSKSQFGHENPFILISLVLLIWLSMFMLRWSAPSDLLDKDQERPAAYMADAALNGNWTVQVDDYGRVCSKPPIYTWMGATLILLTGRINEFALYFPSALGVFGCCLLIWHFGARRFGYSAAFLGAVFLLLSTIGIRILYLARTDAMYSFTTFLTACIGYGCRQKGWNWVWFWLAAVLATLTKGPLGLVLAAVGLVGLFWKCPCAVPRARRWLQHGFGVALFLIISLGWLWLAYRQLGDAVIAKLIGRELYGHTNWASDRFSLNYFFLIIPTLFFFSRFFPWSVPAAYGVWRVWKRPAEDPEERCFERFLAAYLCLGILLFSIFPHQRPDHLFPLLPAAGLLAGREVASWYSRRNAGRILLPSILCLWIVMGIGYGVYYFKIDPNTNNWFAKTAGVKLLAKRIETAHEYKDNIYFVDTPYGLQFYLNMMKQRIDYSGAAQLLQRSEKVLVAVRAIDRLKELLPPNFPLEVVMLWPERGEVYIYIVSNRSGQV